MTSPENFVSRWARLKSESDTEPKTEPAGNGSQPEAVASAGAETPSARQLQRSFKKLRYSRAFQFRFAM